MSVQVQYDGDRLPVAGCRERYIEHTHTHTTINAIDNFNCLKMLYEKMRQTANCKLHGHHHRLFKRFAWRQPWAKSKILFESEQNNENGISEERSEYQIRLSMLYFSKRTAWIAFDAFAFL